MLNLTQFGCCFTFVVFQLFQNFLLRRSLGFFLFLYTRWTKDMKISILKNLSLLSYFRGYIKRSTKLQNSLGWNGPLNGICFQAYCYRKGHPSQVRALVFPMPTHSQRLAPVWCRAPSAVSSQICSKLQGTHETEGYGAQVL